MNPRRSAKRQHSHALRIGSINLVWESGADSRCVVVLGHTSRCHENQESDGKG